MKSLSFFDWLTNVIMKVKGDKSFDKCSSIIHRKLRLQLRVSNYGRIYGLDRESQNKALFGTALVSWLVHSVAVAVDDNIIKLITNVLVNGNLI